MTIVTIPYSVGCLWHATVHEVCSGFLFHRRRKSTNLHWQPSDLIDCQWNALHSWNYFYWVKLGRTYKTDMTLKGVIQTFYVLLRFWQKKDYNFRTFCYSAWQGTFDFPYCNITSASFNAILKHHAHSRSISSDHPKRGNGEGDSARTARYFTCFHTVYPIFHNKHTGRVSSTLSSVTSLTDLTD